MGKPHPGNGSNVVHREGTKSMLPSKRAKGNCLQGMCLDFKGGAQKAEW